MRVFLKFFSMLIVLVTGASMYQIYSDSALAFSSGAPGGNSGSPGDGRTCRSCHSGGAPATLNDAITTDIPTSGYIPGEIYNIQATVSEAGRNLFGFEITAEDENNQKQGDWIIVNSTETRTTNSNNAVTHRSGGNSGNGTRTWNMQWQAPEVNEGAITFYAALMAANNSGGNSGDNVYVSNNQVAANSGNSIRSKAGKSKIDLSIYPNPARNNINVSFPNNLDEDFGVYIIDAMGIVRAFYEQKRTTSGKLNLSIGDLAAGNYYVRIFSDKYTGVVPFIKG